jgi:hypothetical protein
LNRADDLFHNTEAVTSNDTKLESSASASFWQPSGQQQLKRADPPAVQPRPESSLVAVGSTRFGSILVARTITSSVVDFSSHFTILPASIVWLAPAEVTAVQQYRRPWLASDRRLTRK